MVFGWPPRINRGRILQKLLISVKSQEKRVTRKEILGSHAAVDQMNGFPVYVPAGLEAGLIAMIRPPWNHSGSNNNA